MTIAIVIGAILLELFMTRWSYRWDRELTLSYNRQNGKSQAVWNPLWHAFLWWLCLPVWYFDRNGYRSKRGHSTFWTEKRIRMVVGESKWHKAERLALEHKARSEDVGMPAS